MKKTALALSLLALTVSSIAPSANEPSPVSCSLISEIGNRQPSFLRDLFSRFTDVTLFEVCFDRLHDRVDYVIAFDGPHRTENYSYFSKVSSERALNENDFNAGLPVLHFSPVFEKQPRNFLCHSKDGCQMHQLDNFYSTIGLPVEDIAKFIPAFELLEKGQGKNTVPVIDRIENGATNPSEYLARMTLDSVVGYKNSENKSRVNVFATNKVTQKNWTFSFEENRTGISLIRAHEF